MDLILKGQINPCGDFSIIKSSLYYVSNSVLYKYPSKRIVELKEYWGVYFGFYLFNVFTNRSFNSFYDYMGNKISEFENRNFYHVFSSNDFIYFDRILKKTKYNDLCIYDSKIGGNFLCGEVLFIPKDTKIIALNFRTAKTKWQFALTILGTYTPLHKQEQKPFEVDKFLGVWQNELLIACDGGLLLALDIQTGDLTRRWQGLTSHVDTYLQEVFRGQLCQQGYVYQLNQAKIRIDAFFSHYYFYIDLDSGNMRIINCKEGLQKHFIKQFKISSAYAEDETHLYTKVTYDTKALGLDYIPTGLCAFNKQTLEIDWQYRFDKHDDYLATDNPQLSGNKLYQLSASKVLYIFERELNASNSKSQPI